MPARKMATLAMDDALDIGALKAAYEAGLDPAELITALYARIRRDGLHPVWISILSLDALMARVERAKRRRDAGETLPLFGIPFAIKDNIDLAGLPTTAACPAFSYMPARSASVVEKLEAAGAIPLGKTNLDQFATGLVGTRSPYGIPACVFDPHYISGGSSSGSAVAMARGLVSFALGTDTAGSGRAPAAFNNIIGLKPTKGRLSTRGVVPACRSLDCVSVFAGTIADAALVARIAAGFDAEDPYSRRAPQTAEAMSGWPLSFRFGVPAEPLDFFGDKGAEALFAESVERLESLGGRKIPFDFTPFREVGELLYGGPWIAERLAAIRDFAASHADDMLPVTREIILGAKRITAVDAFQSMYRLAELARSTEAEWSQMDVMLLPTTGTIYRIEEIEADPVQLNMNLGRYTNFLNLLDLSAIAIPAGFRRSGLPFGVTVIAHAFQDEALAALGERIHHALPCATIGSTTRPLPRTPPTSVRLVETDGIAIAVLGAHLSGEALNHELTRQGAKLLRTARTARGYRLYALPQQHPPKPGLVFDGSGSGGIEIEIWSLPNSALSSFISGITAPLGIGTLLLDDGSSVKGFLCEAHAVAGAEDITVFGGWRRFLAERRQRAGGA